MIVNYLIVSIIIIVNYLCVRVRVAVDTSYIYLLFNFQLTRLTPVFFPALD